MHITQCYTGHCNWQCTLFSAIPDTVTDNARDSVLYRRLQLTMPVTQCYTGHCKSVRYNNESYFIQPPVICCFATAHFCSIIYTTKAVFLFTVLCSYPFCAFTKPTNTMQKPQTHLRYFSTPTCCDTSVSSSGSSYTKSETCWHATDCNVRNTD